MIALKKIFGPEGKKNYSRDVPLGTLMKGTFIITMAPAILVMILTIYNFINLETAYYSFLFVFVMAVIFVHPYIANLSALTNYVRALAQNRDAAPPDLTFLNNVEELSSAVEELHASWDKRSRQLEANIAESNILIDSLPDVVIMLDKNLRVLKTNSAARSALGEGERPYQEALDAIMQDPVIRGAAGQVMTDRQGQELSYFLPDSQARYFIVRIERFPAYSPSDIALIIVMHDITRQKHTERVLADFVANASHEIRTPLTSVIGFIETLQTSAKEDEEERERFLTIMRAQAERMSRLVNALLSLSKIEQNIHTPPTEKIDIAPLLRAARIQVGALARERNITVTLTIKDKPLETPGEPNELAQVFENLFSNAVKYARENSTVQVIGSIVPNTYKEQKALRSHARLIAVSVADRGEGIADEHIPRLTERFYRVDTARSRKAGGTGLGLSIVKYILDRHCGAMIIESKIGEGSTFTVLLPAYEQNK